ncbi:MAG TPA: hypothetical protein PLI74_12080 [Candidatus Kapabacteria bacterium]|nr:hypothetical protein [Candidatus Kapabacteria bacterium]
MGRFERDGYTPSKQLDQAATELLTAHQFVLTVSVKNEQTNKIEMRSYFSSIDAAGTLLEYSKMCLRSLLIDNFSGDSK